MQAVILAGGYGTRMHPLTFTKAKSMIPLANKPVLEHVINYLSSIGVDEVIVTTNYLREDIMEYFGNGEKYGVKIRYPNEEKPLGTAGSVKNISPILEDTFYVIQGDNITDFDFNKVLKVHKKNGALATIAAYPSDEPWNYGILEIDGERVIRFREKPLKNECFSNIINTGLYVVDKKALDYVPENTFFDFSKDLFPILQDAQAIFACICDGFWIDIGEPMGYLKATNWYLSKNRKNISNTAIIEGQIEGPVVIGENTRISRDSNIIGPVIIGKNAIIKSGVMVYGGSVVGDNAIISEASLLNGTVLFENTSIGKEVIFNDSIIGEGCHIGFGSNVRQNVMLGAYCGIGSRVGFTEGSRVWPNMLVPSNSLVSGTLRQFVQMHSRRDDPLWTLRTVTPDEAFYFNMKKGGHILHTGLRAQDLSELGSVIKKVDDESIKFHLRANINDFSQWIDNVICDDKLAGGFDDIKLEYQSGTDVARIRRLILRNVESRIQDILSDIRVRGIL